MKKLPARVHHVFSLEDDTVLVALDVKLRDNEIEWFDTTKERRMAVKKIIEDSPDRFAFERADGKGGAYLFRPLTLDLYRKHVQKSLLAQKDFATEEEMLAALEQTKKTAW